MEPLTRPVPEADEDALKELIAAELTAVRDRSFGLTTDALDETELIAQISPLMSPLIWDLAHVGNYEELWLLREAAGAEPMRPEIDTLYDAFEHPRATRPSLPLLPPREARTYIATVRSKVLDSLASVRFRSEDPLTSGGFVYGMVVQHEHQHDETMLATHQLRKGAPPARSSFRGRAAGRRRLA
jgi:iron(II)-dependent oxidoreductase